MKKFLKYFGIILAGVIICFGFLYAVVEPVQTWTNTNIFGIEQTVETPEDETNKDNDDKVEDENTETPGENTNTETPGDNTNTETPGENTNTETPGDNTNGDEPNTENPEDNASEEENQNSEG